MGLEAVRDEVLNSAKAEASAIIAEARKEAARIEKDAETKIENMQSRSDLEIKKEIEKIKRQETASAELEAKKIVLEAKKELIDRAFSESAAKLSELGDKERERLIGHIMAEITKSIESGHVYCQKKDSKFIKGYSPEHMDLSGGIIAENREKTIRVDYSFETLLQNVKDKEIQKLSEILFE